ncbi:hypothetical protein KQI84_09910 [bacterium]|nr:hypothetical protein [bacterium]
MKVATVLAAAGLVFGVFVCLPLVVPKPHPAPVFRRAMSQIAHLGWRISSGYNSSEEDLCDLSSRIRSEWEPREKDRLDYPIEAFCTTETLILLYPGANGHSALTQSEYRDLYLADYDYPSSLTLLLDSDDIVSVWLMYDGELMRSMETVPAGQRSGHRRFFYHLEGKDFTIPQDPIAIAPSQNGVGRD